MKPEPQVFFFTPYIQSIGYIQSSRIDKHPGKLIHGIQIYKVQASLTLG
jgi:hypothetical protein